MNYWQTVEAKLLEMESSEKYDLFVLGYIIPHVGLGEANCTEVESPDIYFKNLVKKSVEKDKDTFNADDIETIEAIMKEL